MKIGIAFKLFCAILGAGIVMATAMGVASRISFQNGFLGYLNELENQRLGLLTTALADVYREHGGERDGDHAGENGAENGVENGAEAVDGQDSWSFLRGREDEWRQLVRASDRNFRASRNADGRAAEAGRRAETAKAAEAAEAAKATEPAVPDTLVAEPARAESPTQAASLRLQPSARGEPSQRTTLLDAQRKVIAGNPTPAGDAMFGPIVVDGQTVGWVASVPFRQLTNAADLSFQERQTAAAWYIAGLAVLLAGITAWALGRIVLAPAHRLANATHLLATGRYDTRVAVTSSDELGRLAADFNRLAITLERNENLRREFMADVSHELRTPLAIMRGELEAMEDGLQALDGRSVQSLQTEVGALAKLVDDIHQLSIADVGALSYRRVQFDVAASLRQDLDAFHDRLQARGIAAELDSPPGPLLITGDPDRLTQVFHNILENVVRYADAGARLRVGCRQDARNVEIVFEDSGPGVPDQYLGKLFDRFYRLEGSRNRATGGSGLGLAICQSIVTAHEGTLAAQRSPLGGLALTLRLPAATTTATPKT